MLSGHLGTGLARVMKGAAAALVISIAAAPAHADYDIGLDAYKKANSTSRSTFGSATRSPATSDR